MNLSFQSFVRCISLSTAGVHAYRKMSKNILSVERVQCDSIDLVRPVPAGVGAAISHTQLGAKFEPSNHRQTSADLEEQINKVWETKCAQNPRLYNGSKFRLNGWKVSRGKWILNIGLTSYKDLCGTNLSPNSQWIQEKGTKNFGNPQAYMSDPVGVGLVLITSDGFLVLTRRAYWTGEYPGALDVPGGHPEPQRIFKDDGTLKPEFGASNVDDVVLQEVWSSAAQEAVDELGVSREQMSELTFLGIDLNMDAGGRPSLGFYARLSLSSDQVREVYSRGVQDEADESSELFLVSPETLARLPHLLRLPRESSPPSGVPREGFVTLPEGERRAGKEVEEAIRVVEEATPSLRGALLLTHYHSLLPLV
ncbi:uridine diphosphate glucose pyrophosphatase NUDT22-like [Panulirus ornatus]|uniref:uridine diphosphate glucose pyrophosphatase NUDT22-like n=1 Tax=Panulirus ornatus TaxID=150431 RepID=UPI003A86BE88